MTNAIKRVVMTFAVMASAGDAVEVEVACSGVCARTAYNWAIEICGSEAYQRWPLQEWEGCTDVAQECYKDNASRKRSRAKFKCLQERANSWQLDPEDWVRTNCDKFPDWNANECEPKAYDCFYSHGGYGDSSPHDCYDESCRSDSWECLGGAYEVKQAYDWASQVVCNSVYHDDRNASMSQYDRDRYGFDIKFSHWDNASDCIDKAVECFSEENGHFASLWKWPYSRYEYHWDIDRTIVYNCLNDEECLHSATACFDRQLVGALFGMLFDEARQVFRRARNACYRDCDYATRYCKSGDCIHGSSVRSDAVTDTQHECTYHAELKFLDMCHFRSEYGGGISFMRSGSPELCHTANSEPSWMQDARANEFIKQSHAYTKHLDNNNYMTAVGYLHAAAAYTEAASQCFYKDVEVCTLDGYYLDPNSGDWTHNPGWGHRSWCTGNGRKKENELYESYDDFGYSPTDRYFANLWNNTWKPW